MRKSLASKVHTVYLFLSTSTSFLLLDQLVCCRYIHSRLLDHFQASKCGVNAENHSLYLPECMHDCLIMYSTDAL